MTEKGNEQQKEIERLQKKIRDLSAAYSDTVQELNSLKNEKTTKKKRGRPGIDPKVKARILFCCREGKTIRQTAKELELGTGTVHKVIREAAEKSRVSFVFMDRNKPATLIHAYAAIEKVSIYNLTDQLLSRAFGVRENPTWEDYEAFLEDRCMPRTRYGIRDELEYLGIHQYDPFQIIEKTQGRVYGDSQWLKRLSPEEISVCDHVIKEEPDPIRCRERLIELFSDGGAEND